jgi:hypothetical protein
MNWGISVSDSAETYEGLTDDEGIDMQNRAMELTQEAMEELQDNLHAELGYGFKVELYV